MDDSSRKVARKMEKTAIPFWKTTGWIAIIVALIGALGAVVSSLVSRSDPSSGRHPTSVAPSSSATVPPGAGDDACRSAQIVQPRATRSRPDAKLFPTPREVTLSWEPRGCVLVVQYHQGNTLRGEWKQQTSGTRFDLGPPLFGETEIKLWREPPGVMSDAVWVWVSQE